MQYESATNGNIAMQILLGKQYLGQRDNLDQRVNTEIQVRADYGIGPAGTPDGQGMLADDRCHAGRVPAAPDEKVSTGDQTEERKALEAPRE